MSDTSSREEGDVSEQPLEMLAITFFETPCLAVRGSDGSIYLSIRDVCSAIGLRLNGQLRRLRAHPEISTGMARFRVPTAGGRQVMEFLILEFVPAWIATVSRANATPAVQERLRYFTLFAVREVYAAVAREAGLPAGPSRQIEDLGDLTAFDTSIQRLAERQQAIEESQDKARQAWRDLDRRVRALEEVQADGRLSSRQRGVVYHLVQAWAQERATREASSTSIVFRACWSAVRTRYKVARYEDIPARYYDDCVTYIQRHYQKLTGADLQLPEQGELDL
jgi:P22_AR N-terminal domain/ORF6C domain